jgi:hypothetical protein
MFDGDAGGTVRYAWRVKKLGSHPSQKEIRRMGLEVFFILNIRLPHLSVRI